ncbi:MAG: acyl-CoA dehydrogenase [Actinophytocola sp.]|uniref:acyl-CoA dehydrogenase family protein n=1 Tax=Actinophytocola sp. TaxID=1872138 RepID=UPI001325B3B5|nr:acyl-CoA dehydrogenase family protein [Actinophytocola sp.]MPZ80067.1 acyl-CoA dehydrogenase [Actinophytocola sp.]
MLPSRTEEIQGAVRTWLSQIDRPPVDFGMNRTQTFATLRDWQRQLYDAGWLGIGWRAEYGGRPGTGLDQITVYEEIARERLPLPIGILGLDIVGPTILEHGTEEQRTRYIPPLLCGDEIWCQGFSEPEAGSDLASLRTKATYDESARTFIVNGQKVWTSWADHADQCALLVRTGGPDSRQRGISYLLVPMDTAGIEVRPLTQITGDQEFCEVFFTDVVVPAENLLGEVNDGWRTAMSTLAHERGGYLLRRRVELRAAMDDFVNETLPALGAPDDIIEAKVGQCYVLLDALDARAFDVARRLESDQLGHETAIDKLFLSKVEQAVFGGILDMLGDQRMLEMGTDGTEQGRWIHDYLYGRASSIYSGTAQVQRNIVANRVLGLPR